MRRVMALFLMLLCLQAPALAVKRERSTTPVPTPAPTLPPTAAPTATPVPMEGYGRIVEEEAELHLEPEEDSYVRRTLSAGARVRLMALVADSRGNLWMQVDYGGGPEGYLPAAAVQEMVAEEVEPVVIAIPEPEETAVPVDPVVLNIQLGGNASGFPFEAKTNASSLNVRKTADRRSERVTQIRNSGTAVDVLGETTDESGSLWYQVRLASGKQGYVLAEYLTPTGKQVQTTPHPTAQPASADPANLYGLAIQKLATRSGPGTSYKDAGTYEMKGKYIHVLSRAYSNGVWWVKCEIPYQGEVRVLWTGYKRFDASTLPLEAIPLEE